MRGIGVGVQWREEAGSKAEMKCPAGNKCVVGRGSGTASSSALRATEDRKASRVPGPESRVLRAKFKVQPAQHNPTARFNAQREQCFSPSAFRAPHSTFVGALHSVHSFSSPLLLCSLSPLPPSGLQESRHLSVISTVWSGTQPSGSDSSTAKRTFGCSVSGSTRPAWISIGPGWKPSGMSIDS